MPGTWVPLGRVVKKCKFGLMNSYKDIYEELAGFRRDILVSNQTWSAIRNQVSLLLGAACRSVLLIECRRADHSDIVALLVVAPLSSLCLWSCICPGWCVRRDLLGVCSSVRDARALVARLPVYMAPTMTAALNSPCTGNTVATVPAETMHGFLPHY